MLLTCTLYRQNPSVVRRTIFLLLLTFGWCVHVPAINPAAATATVSIDIATRQVTISPKAGIPGSILSGSEIGFTTPTLTDDPNRPNIKALRVSIINRSGRAVGSAPLGYGGLRSFIGFFTGSPSTAVNAYLYNSVGTAFDYGVGEALPYVQYPALNRGDTSPSQLWMIYVPPNTSKLVFQVGVQEMKLRLPGMFQDHMVMQRNTQTPIWGWANPGDKIDITGSWGATATALTDSTGYWQGTITTAGAGGPFTLTVSGRQTISIRDVMLGDVWLCSGQSNMEFPVSQTSTYQPSSSNLPNVRLFHAFHQVALRPFNDLPGDWRVSTTAGAYGFSGVGFYFARKLYGQLNVPVGMIECAYGGTFIQTWMSAESLNQPSSAPPQAPGGGESLPFSSLYNGMINPLIPYGLKGFIWYQGEDNVHDSGSYHGFFSSMISDWRRRWALGDLPFYFCQIAPYNGYFGDGSAPRLREAQTQVLNDVSNTGMVVTTDTVTDTSDIHPPNKQVVGERLADWALSRTYGISSAQTSGPIYRNMQIEGVSIRIYFLFSKLGLISKGGALTEFQIAGPDQLFYPASAQIQGQTVVVHSPFVSNPVAVRFGWSDSPQPNLYNVRGLPASPFRTDSWRN